jgi:hypothetical protein
MPTYFLTVFALKKWIIKRMDKLRLGFLWKGSEVASGGHYLVRWKNVQKPKSVCVCVWGGGPRTGTVPLCFEASMVVVPMDGA